MGMKKRPHIIILNPDEIYSGSCMKRDITYGLMEETA